MAEPIKPEAKVKKTPGRSKATKARSEIIEETRQLVELMIANDLSELNVEEGERKILLKRGPQVVAAVAGVHVAPAAPPAPAEAKQAGPDLAPEDDGLLEITSPMVGTLYSSPSPDSDPYIKVNATIDVGDVVAIVEAMKVMNEIKSDHAGTIVEVCVKSTQPVEFGQVLFKVRPA